MKKQNANQIIIYTTQDGQTKIRVSVSPQENTVWLSQMQMAELFQTTKQNVSLHIKNVFEESELDPSSTVKEYLTVQKEGNRNVERSIEYYNLEEKPYEP